MSRAWLPRLCGLALLLAPAGVAGEERPFVHPGLLHRAEDFERMREKVAAGEEPWAAGWRALLESPFANPERRARPLETVVRGGEGQNFPQLFQDVHAAYQLALRWRIADDEACGAAALAILNAWSSELRTITGNADRFLAAGLYGYQFANAAEILRDHPDWSREDFARFQTMMTDVFLPLSRDFLVRHNDAAITNYWANWDLCNIAAIQAIGILCDRRDLYREALDYLHHGGGNGALDKSVYHVHPGHLGQWQESGRDQGHSTLGIALMAAICETAWNQGDDLYGYRNHRLLAAAEYVAKYNLGEEVPFVTYAWGLGQRGDRREQTEISEDQRGHLRNGFETIVHHYRGRLGIATPWSERYARQLRPESGGGGHAGTFDQVGLGTLTATREPEVADPRPSGLVALKHGPGVILCWWGVPDAETYTVRRLADGAEETVASGIADPLTFTDAEPPAGLLRYTVAAVAGGREIAVSEPVSLRNETTLRLHLPFEQVAEGRSPDAADGSREAQLRGGAAPAVVAGARAIALDGGDGHLVLPPGIVAELSDFTVSTWLFLDEARAGARVFDFGDERGQRLYLSAGERTGGPRFGITSTYGHNERRIEAGEPLPTGRWVHLALSLAGREGAMFVDGERVAEAGGIDLAPFRLGPLPQHWLGRSAAAGAPFLRGAIADFRIHDGALEPAAIAALAAAGPPR